MIPKRTISATCEISTGTLILDTMAPTFVGENYATTIQVALKNGGAAYSPSGCQASMYLYWPGTPNMTGAVEMEISGSTATGEMSEDMTLMSGCPLLVIQLVDEVTGDLIVAAASPIQIINVRGSVVISGRAPSPSEIIYIGRAPYIGQNGHWYEWDVVDRVYKDTGTYAAARSPYVNSTSGCWMVWDSTNEQYVDSGIVARGIPATFTATATTLAAGSQATAAITGTADNPVLNLGIPRGADSPVQTVCGVSADGTGNVPVQDSNIPCSEVSGQTTVEGAISALNGQIGNLALEIGPYMFEINGNGHLILYYPDDYSGSSGPPFRLASDGHLYYDY